MSGRLVVCLEYLRLHQGQDYTVYLWYCSGFDFITEILNEEIFVGKHNQNLWRNIKGRSQLLTQF